MREALGYATAQKLYTLQYILSHEPGNSLKIE